MALGELTRIKNEGNKIRAVHSVKKTNEEHQQRNLRLATGSKLNKAEDDTADFSLAKKLEARVRGQAQALANIGDANSLLSVAEDNLGSVSDLLMTMKEKAIQAGNDTLGTDERAAIKQELDSLSANIDDVLGGSEFNGEALFSSGGSSFTFAVEAQSGDTFTADFDGVGAAVLGVAPADLDVSSAGGAQSTLENIEASLESVDAMMAELGDSQKRLSHRADAVSVSTTRHAAARSQIEDADMAREQMEILKLQIMQRKNTALLVQANISPERVLNLFG